jgi:hypothetical protein
LVLLGLACLIIVYYAVAVPVEQSFGERYVTPEIPLIFPFYVIASFKPITLIAYLTFAGVVLLLEASREFLSKYRFKGLKVVLTFLAFASGYEVIWNFFAWFSLWTKIGGSLDLIPNVTHQYVSLPANFNFATKITWLVFSLSLYGAFFLQNLEHGASPKPRN